MAFDRERHYPNADVEEVDFTSYEGWRAFIGKLGITSEMSLITPTFMVFTSPLRFGISPAKIVWDRENMRETGLTQGISSRVRAILYAFHACVGDCNKFDLRIYGAEAITEFALLLRGHFPKFIGSEYTADEQVAANLYPIPNEDLTRLSQPAGIFDVAITSEVLEHVPDLDQALRELARILKPGGWHIGTCPFACMAETSIVKTRIEAGHLVHLIEPEYHGNPMSAEGSLVFEIPSWDILDRARAAGFSRAIWKWVRSRTFGIAATDTGGNFVLCLQK